MSAALKISNLSCQKGYNRLFNNLSFAVKSGDILRITGANGSGKTSLFKIIAGLGNADTGSVFLNQTPSHCAQYRQQVFYLGHLPAISLELSVIENLEFLLGLNSTSAHINLIQALKNVTLQGYENEQTNKLSAGQKRRVILAGLFVSDAVIWLLDEPFTALDSDGVKIVEKQIIRHSQQGGICLFSSHQNVRLPKQKTLSL